MEENISSVAEKIRKLEVQGARNVAIAAITAINSLAQSTRARTRQDFMNELFKARDILFLSRETEPLMRNALRWIISEVESSCEESVENLAERVTRSSSDFLDELENSRRRIAEMGARRIPDDAVIFTHCHSSTVSFLLKVAKEQGKAFEVVCTETRPFFQGRLTAQEMLSLNIKTTLIVDSAARSFIRKADLAIVGADAITSEGNVINKIGTSMIALAAKESRIPFYVVSELLKFDSATMCGEYEPIEERSPSEIWENPPENLLIRNPAFDVTRRDFVHGIICEEGIIPPHSVIEVVHRKYPWLLV